MNQNNGVNMSENAIYNIPIVLFVFKRYETVKLIVEKIRSVKPQIVYVFSDAARADVPNEDNDVLKVREYIEGAIDWECEKKLFYAEENKGCDRNIRDGLDVVFSECAEAVIFEDDAVPSNDFFWYCKELLGKYKNERKVQYIAGFNAIGDNELIKGDYTFGCTPPMSGAFATWADRWNECDFEIKDWPTNRRADRFKPLFYSAEMYKKTKREYDDVYNKKVTAWDFMFEHDMLNKQRVAVVPKWNLATSYGYVEGAFHPQKKREAKRLLQIMTCSDKKLSFPLQGPEVIQNDTEYCFLRQKKMLEVNGNYFERRIIRMYLAFKNVLYRLLPSGIWTFIRKLIKE